jgi:hypothetical protein
VPVVPSANVVAGTGTGTAISPPQQQRVDYTQSPRSCNLVPPLSPCFLHIFSTLIAFGTSAITATVPSQVAAAISDTRMHSLSWSSYSVCSYLHFPSPPRCPPKTVAPLPNGSVTLARISLDPAPIACAYRLGYHPASLGFCTGRPMQMASQSQ